MRVGFQPPSTYRYRCKHSFGVLQLLPLAVPSGGAETNTVRSFLCSPQSEEDCDQTGVEQKELYLVKISLQVPWGCSLHYSLLHRRSRAGVAGDGDGKTTESTL